MTETAATIPHIIPHRWRVEPVYTAQIPADTPLWERNRKAVVDANLSDADLSGADLSGADLSGADLSDADLRGADLRGANLSPIEADFYHVLVGARNEVPGLLRAIREGRVDGSTYTGECACLVGTIANVRAVDYHAIHHDSSRPIERFFMGINKGDTPATNQVSAIVEGWALKFLGHDPAVPTVPAMEA